MVISYLETGIEFIERNLFLGLSVDECAKAAGYSTYHYCRVFNTRLGISVKAYIRKRRVSEAAKLISGSSLSLKEIGYRCGFNSQENFIRVFKGTFGIAPSDFRRTGYAMKLIEKLEVSQLNGLALDYQQFPEPKIQRLSAFEVVGRKHLTTFENERHFQDVPVFWNQFYAEKVYDSLGCLSEESRIDHGVSLLEGNPLFDEDNQRKSLDFYYLTGVRVTDGMDIPNDLDCVTIPASLYAVFQHQPATTDNLIQKLIDTWHYIDYYWLPNSAYEHAGGFEFNEYFPTINPLSKCIYIPIRLKAEGGLQIED